MSDTGLGGKNVLVTAGPTYEPIDPVRFIGNRSSGKTGYAIAEEAARRGAEVTLVSGPTSLPDPISAQVETVRVETADQMLAAARDAFTHADAAVFTAAVADFKPALFSERKIKKDPGRPDEGLVLHLVRNPDILATLAAHKADRFVDADGGTAADAPAKASDGNGEGVDAAAGRRPVFVVGFAAETGDVIRYAKSKLLSKHADLIVANDVSDPALGFGTDDNKVWFVSADGVRELPVCSKAQIARAVLDVIEGHIS
jgi:phosphopantothenoylcysteine decarboxylase/phosphopantothenate--cysteine ligase